MIRLTNPSRRTRDALRVIAWMSVLLLGCAPANEDGENAQNAGAGSSTHAESSAGSGAGEFDHSDKPLQETYSLKKDYCCAVKSGNKVKWCASMHANYASAELNCRAALSDNVVRDGKCTTYASCEGKIRLQPPGITVGSPPDHLGPDPTDDGPTFPK